MLCLAQRHAGHDTEGQRLFRRRDDVLVPPPDDHGQSVEVRPSRELVVTGQTAADTYVSTCITSADTSVTAGVLSRTSCDASGERSYGSVSPMLGASRVFTLRAYVR